MMKVLAILGVFFIEVAFGSGESCSYPEWPNWPDWARPGEECEPYDGSCVPNCKYFIDPALKQPYYHQHSSDCSKFWECGPELETCLFQCAECGDSPLCTNPYGQKQKYLSYNYTIPYPDGPVCDWPANIDCKNGGGECDCEPWQTCVGGLCTPQCMENSHCPDGYDCDECGWCVGHKCVDDSECKHNTCDPPNNPHTTCEFCNGVTGECSPGCADNDNSLCPDSYPICGHGGGPHLCGCNADEDCKDDELCNVNDHFCYPKPILGCDNNDANCATVVCCEEYTDPQDFAKCQYPYNTCEWCDDIACKDGCSDNSKCPSYKPICGASGQPHVCGCNTDSDCTGDYNTCSGNVCTFKCHNDTDCPPNGICDINNHPDYLQCNFCDAGSCTPGCVDSQHCPADYVCAANLCVAQSGKTLLKSLKITSESCTGCEATDGDGLNVGEGLQVTLNGNPNVANKVACKTNILNHNSDVDFDQGSAIFTEKTYLGEWSVKGCLLAPLDGVLSDSEYTWTGTGDWQGSTICAEWIGDDVFAQQCQFVDDKITNCETVGQLECP